MNNNKVLEHIPHELLESSNVHAISDVNTYTKTFGLEYNTVTDTLHLTIPELSSHSQITKRVLVLNIAKVFEVLGWFSPTIISMKILLQRVWELRIDWDEFVPIEIQSIWIQWKSELLLFMVNLYLVITFLRNLTSSLFNYMVLGMPLRMLTQELSYLRIVDSLDHIHVFLVMSKTKVSPIKKLSIPHLELCSAQVLAHLLNYVKDTLQVPMSHVFTWTHSTIVLNWLSGNPRGFKTFVGNRVSSIVDQIPPDRWSHVIRAENPADCASCGIFHLELLEHKL